MADLVNLNRVRKQKARDAKAEAAAENRVRHGRTKAQKELEKREAEIVAARLDGHRLEDGE